MNKKMPKVISIYLPQFHETKDNNIWWGKGFTDWEAVKNAESCFDGHAVPTIPMDNNYYDLSRYDTMKWQAEMAKKYGIDGFSFYHYYFENGKMELETPAENLLKWKDIDMPFCFNWASESWIRSWSNISGNVWSEKFEKKTKNNTNGILVRQNYGEEKEWERHFLYLLPFFKDPRYIRIDGKPVFIFYNARNILRLNEMLVLWKRLALKFGLGGVYTIGVNMNILGTNLDASMIYQPRKAITKLNDIGKVVIKNGVRCFDCRDIWDAIIDEKPYVGCKTYFTGITGYDDTPRRGKSGECIIENTPNVFEEGMERLLKKSVIFTNELVFVNAWNEWGEGMYLEPDEKWKCSYLESIRKAKYNITKSLDSIGIVNNEDGNAANSEIQRLRAECEKYMDFTELLSKWLEAERKGKINFKNLFEKMEINSVAIYGMSMLGKQLFQQLKKEEINVVFGIDRYVGQYGKDVHIFRPEETYPEVDAIIVTTYDDTPIIKMLKGKCTAQILTLVELIERFWKD